MHKFDHPSDTATLVGDTLDDWVNSIDHNYLAVCQGKKVLEIASGLGKIARRILQHDPLSLIMVEPDESQSPDVTLSDRVRLIPDDINLWLSEPRHAEVVICFGLLYHLHNSLHLTELIVNYCNPETIIFDNVVAPHPLSFDYEPNNVAGCRQTIAQWKYAPFNLVTPFFVINNSLDHMGYKLVKSHHVQFNTFPKSNSWVAEWRKKR